MCPMFGFPAVRQRFLFGATTLLLPFATLAEPGFAQLAAEPRALAWSAGEVEQANVHSMRALV